MISRPGSYIQVPERNRNIGSLCNFRCPIFNLLKNLVDLFAVQVPQFQAGYHLPGNYIIGSGKYVIFPTVPTCLPSTLLTASFTAITNFEAASKASCRLFMGVVPAWLANPSTVTSQCAIPTIPSTTPIWSFSCSSMSALFNMQFEIDVIITWLFCGESQVIRVSSNCHNAIVVG